MSLIDLPQAQQSSEPIRDSVTTDDLPIFTADPASFMVTISVINKVRESVTELRTLLVQNRPELNIVIDSVLAKMSDTKFIRILGDRIFVLRWNPYVDFMNKGMIPNFARVLNILIDRIYKNHMAGIGTKNGDQLAWRAYPDHPKVRRQVNKIIQDALKELDKLQAQIQQDPDCQADQVRMVTLVNGNLDPVDF